MAGPFDYTVQSPNIVGSILGGIQGGQQLRANQDALEARDEAVRKQKEYEADFQNYIQNPTFKSTADFIAKHPGSAKPFETSWNIRSKGQNDQIFSTGIQALNALDSNRPEVALKLFDDQISAIENAGEDSKDFKSIRDSIERNPTGAKGVIGLALASYKPEEFSKIAQTRREEAKAPYELGKLQAESGIKQVEARYAPEREFLESSKGRAELRNIDSQIQDRSKRLFLDKDRLQSDVELKLNELGQKATTLDDSAKKIVNEAAISSVVADQAAGSMLDLAGRIEKEGGGYGALTNATEWLKNATGNQNALTDMRKEYIRLRNTQAIKMLPPGVATDRDMVTAMEGFPSPSADAGTLSSFLRGMAKMNQIAAVGENAKSEWVNSVGHLGKPKNDIVIDGVSVPAGTTFTDFTRNYLSEKAGQRGAEQAQTQVPQRSYMKYAQPRAQ